MLSFFTTLALYLGALLLCSLPAVIVAMRDDYHRGTARNFLLAAIGCGLVCGLVAAGSRRQVEQCQNAGNTQCFDSGTTGMITVVIVIFLTASVIRAYLMATE